MAQTLTLIHTSPTLTPMFTALCTSAIPDVQLVHMVDESLIKDTIREGQLRRVTTRRLLALIDSAQQSGTDAVLVTCSSIGPAVAIGQKIFDIPVIRIDDAMAEKAVRMGRRIGVAATLRTTLDPTISLLQQKAAEAGQTIDIVAALCQGAFDAVLSGDTATHDRLLSECLVRDLQDVDLIVLAQASMARVVNSLPPGTLRPEVLSSPELAVMRARDVLASVRQPDTAGVAV